MESSSDKKPEIPKAIKEYIKNNYTHLKIERLAADTGLPQEEISNYIKLLYEKINARDTTLVSLSCNLEKGSSIPVLYWYVSPRCPIESLMSFIVMIKSCTINGHILETLDNAIKNMSPNDQKLMRQAFPNGILGTQPIVDPLLALGETTPYV